eukprot:84982_1
MHRTSQNAKAPNKSTIKQQQKIRNGSIQRKQSLRNTLSNKKSKRRMSHRVDEKYLRNLGIATANSDPKSLNPVLIKEIEQLRAELIKEQRKGVSAKKKSKESLALLSETMFKKLLVEENDFTDEMNTLKHTHGALQKQKSELETSKIELLVQSNIAIDQMREQIKHLSDRLQKYAK